MSVEKAYSTDCNMLGATHEAKDLERLDVSIHIRRADHGRRHWRAGARIEPERVDITFERGRPKATIGQVVHHRVGARAARQRRGRATASA